VLPFFDLRIVEVSLGSKAAVYEAGRRGRRRA